MEEYIYWIVGGLFVLFESFFRRVFGGLFSSIPYKDTTVADWCSDHYISIRFISQVANIAAITLALHYCINQSWWEAGIIALIVQILFWLPGHGPFFDLGRDTTPSQDIIKRYDKEWYTKILYWGFKPEHYYGEFFDYCGMLLRYGLPTLLLIPFYGISILVLPFALTSVYGICWAFADKNKTSHPTDIAEYIVGAIAGAFIYFDPIWLVF